MTSEQIQRLTEDIETVVRELIWSIAEETKAKTRELRPIIRAIAGEIVFYGPAAAQGDPQAATLMAHLKAQAALVSEIARIHDEATFRRSIITALVAIAHSLAAVFLARSDE